MKKILIIVIFSRSLFAVMPDISMTNIIEEELVGYGSETTGGKNGDIYNVTTLTDDPNETCVENSLSGSMRCALESEGALWIRFSVDGNLKLLDPVYIKSNKTLDGRGKNIRISNNTLRIWSKETLEEMTGNRKYIESNLYNVENVIIMNIAFDNTLLGDREEHSGTDALSLKGTKNIWVHKCSFFDWEDDQIAMSYKSDRVTISYNEFTTNINFKDQRVMQFGKGTWYTKDDKDVSLTFHHNYIYNVYRRIIMIKSGKAHMYNNVISNTYGPGTLAYGTENPDDEELQDNEAYLVRAQIYVENNIYQNVDIYYNGLRALRCENSVGPDPTSSYFNIVEGAIKISDNWISSNEGYWFEEGEDNESCLFDFEEEGLNPSDDYNYSLETNKNLLLEDVLKNAGTGTKEGFAATFLPAIR